MTPRRSLRFDCGRRAVVVRRLSLVVCQGHSLSVVSRLSFARPATNDKRLMTNDQAEPPPAAVEA